MRTKEETKEYKKNYNPDPAKKAQNMSNVKEQFLKLRNAYLKRKEMAGEE